MAGLLTTTDVANITATVTSSLDQSLPWTRNTGQGTSNDGYGHSTETDAAQGSILCNVKRPTATLLQAYAGIIGSKRALVLRVLSSATIREGDHVTFDGLVWTVEQMLDASSYTVTKSYIMTSVV